MNRDSQILDGRLPTLVSKKFVVLRCAILGFPEAEQQTIMKTEFNNRKFARNHKTQAWDFFILEEYVPLRELYHQCIV